MVAENNYNKQKFKKRTKEFSETNETNQHSI